MASGPLLTSEPIQGSFDAARLTLTLIDNAISKRNHEGYKHPSFLAEATEDI